ncbi:DUF3916 domain-containing protein [Nocardia sp. NPDC051756]|uniref:DUF3916 domain-containing protein n=1 Tax=Nocardia sp. NPDC051756 TaxID=3154751 RepID=UPI003433320F
MRRLDLHPAKKLRNPGRHLRRLAQWPEWIVDQIPDTFAEQRYWNFKIPVFNKLVDSPQTTNAIRKACLATIFAAAEAVEKSPRRPPHSRIACLVNTPDLFNSEVTIFLSEDYFNGFRPVAETQHTDYPGGWIETTPADSTALTPIRPPEPPGLTFLGGTHFLEFDEEWPDLQITRTLWNWTYPHHQELDNK